MSPSTSKNAAPSRKRRTFTPRFFRKAKAYYDEHGWQATAKHFRISGSTMQQVRSFGSNGHAGGPQAAFIAPRERTGRSLYLAAKALERALSEHRRAGNPPSDIEHYAFFLLREILK